MIANDYVGVLVVLGVFVGGPILTACLFCDKDIFGCEKRRAKAAKKESRIERDYRLMREAQSHEKSDMAFAWFIGVVFFASLAVALFHPITFIPAVISLVWMIRSIKNTSPLPIKREQSEIEKERAARAYWTPTRIKVDRLAARIRHRSRDLCNSIRLRRSLIRPSSSHVGGRGRL